MNTQEKIEVMQAFVDGKKIQISSDGEWTDWCSNVQPVWAWGKANYRIKPEPKVIYVNEYDDRRFYAYESKEHAERCSADNLTRGSVKYIEVLDDE